jgi:hypothetical protein
MASGADMQSAERRSRENPCGVGYVARRVDFDPPYGEATPAVPASGPEESNRGEGVDRD